MKVYTTKINESWIIDRIKKEWIENNKNIITKSRYFADIVWIIAPWSIKESDYNKFRNKKVIASIYHIENKSFDSPEVKNILELDKYVHAYHTISKKTKLELEKITNKPIYFLPLWVNQNIWFFIQEKNQLREKYGLKAGDYLIGSFQRDTEGFDRKSPKLVKGPDIFIEIVKQLNKKHNNLKVILSGKRRNYVISELHKNKIDYKYFEMADFSTLNELYNILDLYLVTSRLEGGPQALVECGQTMTPIISTNVGIADEILSNKSIMDSDDISTFKDSTPDVDFAFKQSSKLTIPNGMSGYIKMFSEIYEN